MTAGCRRLLWMPPTLPSHVLGRDFEQRPRHHQAPGLLIMGNGAARDSGHGEL